MPRVYPTRKNPIRYYPGTAIIVPPSLPLDIVTGASAAYSVRKLRSAYAGKALRIRRSSDNVEQDIGFNGNDFDTAAALAFCGSNTGSVTTWYDQSGNGIDVTCPTGSGQATIIVAGSMTTKNGKPSLPFNGGQQLFSAIMNILQQWSVTSVAAGPASPGTPNSIFDSDDTGRIAQYLRISTGSQIETITFNSSNTAFSTNAPISAGNLNVVTALRTGTNLTAYGNGTAGTTVATSGTPNSSGGQRFIIGRRLSNGATQDLTGFISELIFFQSNSANISNSDRVSLETNQKSYFSTP